MVVETLSRDLEAQISFNESLTQKFSDLTKSACIRKMRRKINDNQLTLTKAEKCQTLVLMDKMDYNHKLFEFLKDSKV